MRLVPSNDNYDPDASPFNALPPVVVALALAIAAVEVIFYLGSTGLVGGADAIAWRRDGILEFALLGKIVTPYLETGQYEAQAMMRFVTHVFVHTNFTSTAFVVVFILALGKLTAEAFGSVAFLIVYFGSAAIGAFIYWLIFREQAVLIGGYSGAFGLIGAFTFVRWVALSMAGSQQYQAFYLIGMFMGLRLIFGILFGAQTDWVAELAGFFAGFALSFFLTPGGTKAMLRRLRRT